MGKTSVVWIIQPVLKTSLSLAFIAAGPLAHANHRGTPSLRLRFRRWRGVRTAALLLAQAVLGTAGPASAAGAADGHQQRFAFAVEGEVAGMPEPGPWAVSRITLLGLGVVLLWQRRNRPAN